MKLLIATDHCFYRLPEGVFNIYCFDQEFFSDYRKVFEEVEVVSRMEAVSQLIKGGQRSDGNGVSFIDIPNLRGARWLLYSGKICVPIIRRAIEHVDAVMVRVPSQLGWLAARLAVKLNKPYMAEVIGDPVPAVLARSSSFPYRVVAWNNARQLKTVVRKAAVVSYVNPVYLPTAYPIRTGTPHDFISSIRLKAEDILLPRRDLLRDGKLRIVLVASLVPYKRHSDLLAAIEAAGRQGISLEAHFAGDGPERGDLAARVQIAGLQDRVTFHGHVVGKEAVNRLLDSSNLFILPSGPAEGLPRAMLEAMARGLPVIGSNIPATSPLLRPEDRFVGGDVQALVDLIAALAKDNPRLEKMSEHSVKTASQYTDDILSPKRVCLYQYLRQYALGQI